jgi:trk system potassium uptake protein TrkA
VVVDANQEALNNLDPEFRGRTIEGDVLTEKLLERAGIVEVDGLAAVTNSDTLNAVVAHIARSVYNVPIVVVRNYDPAMRPVLEAFDLQVVSSTSWGAQRIQELMLDPTFRTIFSAGNGEVEIYEMLIPADWSGKKLGDLLEETVGCLPVALTRAGRAILPDADTLMQAGDLINISATFDGIQTLHERLNPEKEA